MKDELITFEERSCQRIPGDMLQEKIDNYRKGSESDLHYFVHGIVTDSVGDPPKKNGSAAPEDVPVDVERNTERGKLPRKRWTHLTSGGTSVVEVSRGTSTGANTNGKPMDDHYLFQLEKPDTTHS